MRYAIYFTPPKDDALTRAAADWLGRDPFTGREAGDGAPLSCISSSLARYHTAAPRRYGFHATIVAPFRPAEGVTDADVIAALEAFCAREAAFDTPVALKRLMTFLALMVHEDSTAMDAMAARAVEHFNGLRAPLGEVDIARRDPDRLTPRQREYLDRWGYPYVMEEFRFHMTLSGSLDADAMPMVEAAAREHFQPFLDRPLAVDGLAIFVEPEAGAPFNVLRRVEFSGKRS